MVIMLASSALVIAPIITDADGAPAYDADYYLSASSKQAENSRMSITIDDSAIVTYSRMSWVLYLSQPAQVSHTAPSGAVIVNEVLGAGLYKFDYVIDPAEFANVALKWAIGEDVKIYNLRVASSQSQAYEWTRDDTITITESWLTDEEKRIAIGCIICALIPAIPIIPLLRRRAEDEIIAPF